MPHHPKNKHKFYIHWQLIRDSRLWIVSLFEDYYFWFYFFQVLTQTRGHVPPCSWPAPCQQQLCHTSPGIRQERASPKPPHALLCSSGHTQRQWDKTPSHFRSFHFCNPAEGYHCHKGTDMDTQAFGYQIMSPATNWAWEQRNSNCTSGLASVKGRELSELQIYLFSLPGFWGLNIWNCLPREVAGWLSLDVFKKSLEVALGDRVQLGC